MRGPSLELEAAATQGGKESIGIDLRNPDGKEVAKRLIARSDVVVENFGPGVIDRLGLGYETVKQINPRAIFASLKGFNAECPWSEFNALDPVIQAACGATSVTGEMDNPRRPHPPLADIPTGITLCTGILAALVQRESIGGANACSSRCWTTGSTMHVIPTHATSQAGPSPNAAGTCRLTQPTWSSRGLPLPRRPDRTTTASWKLTQTTSGEPSPVRQGFTRWAEIQDFKLASCVARMRQPSVPRSRPGSPVGRKHEAMETLLRAGVRAAAVLTPYDVMQHKDQLLGEDTLADIVVADGAQ